MTSLSQHLLRKVLGCDIKGKLPQIENALAAVSKGETSLGFKAKNGVVIATEKKLAES